VAAVYKEAGKQEMYLKQRPEELKKAGRDCQGSQYRGIKCHRRNRYHEYTNDSLWKVKPRPKTVMSRNLELDPLIAIPVFIHDFLCIHPVQ